ncbi:MAG TPA: alpha-glucosidase [Chitinophagales bacterium]
MKCFFLILTLGLTSVVFAQSQPEWWRRTTVYQIYPRSFYDTNGDGIGDLKGIIQKLDYIQSLGFETIWISPFFKSPQADFGYDISDYRSIAPEYGDMQLCETLIKEVHQRGMRIVFDMVMNHTSNQHPWFTESASSRANAKADWYVWKNGKGRNGKRPPNNWKAMIGGSGWHYHEGRKQFYWASFLPFQPDLNYHNSEVKQEMLNTARFWLAKGVDGFRLDIFNAIYEDTSFHNNPFSFRIIPNEQNPDGFFQKAKYNINHEKSFEFATELRAVTDEFPEKFMVGEVFGNAATLKKFSNYQGKNGLHTIFLFKTLTMPFKAKTYRKITEEFEAQFPEPFEPTYVFGNHDRTRNIMRVKGNIDKAKLKALYQFTVRGIPFTYYGEELGMPNERIKLKDGKDPLAQRYKWIAQGLVNLSEETLNRDEVRTPMLWDSSANAGFSTSTPWLPVSQNYKELNVQMGQKNEQGLLRFYQKLLAFRNEYSALQNGRFETAKEYCSKNIFAYRRIESRKKLLILLNMSAKPCKISTVNGKIVFSTHTNSENGVLQPWEGKVIEE